MSSDLLGKKVEAKGKTGEIVRVYEVIGLKDDLPLNVKRDDDTVSFEYRSSYRKATLNHQRKYG
jgi:hypothetical protein